MPRLRKIIFALLFALLLPAAAPVVMAQDTDAARQEAIEKSRERLRKMVEERQARLKAEAEKRNAPTTAAPAQPQTGRPQPQPQPQPPNRAKPTTPAPQPSAPSPATPNGMGNSGPEVALMLKPYHHSVEPGQTFMTEVTIYSAKEHAFDQVRLRIRYPNEYVRPVRVFDFPIADLLYPDTPPEVDIGEGVLRYDARMADSTNFLGHQPLIKVVWQAQRAITRADLELGGPGVLAEMQSSVLLGEEDLLAAKSTIGQACVNAVVEVASAGPAARTDLTPIGRDANLTSESPERVGLRIEQPQTPPKQGGRFVLNVWLDNPRRVAFDDVRLAIGFDPEKARVLDWDYQNWIRRGTNIFDGHAHETFPFAVHKNNEVDNQTGRIQYRMGYKQLIPQNEGLLVRIHAEAIEEGAARSFHLFPKSQPGAWRTDIRAEGRSVLQKPDADERIANR